MYLSCVIRPCNLLCAHHFLINGIFFLICIFNASRCCFHPFFLFALSQCITELVLDLVLDHSAIFSFYLNVDEWWLRWWCCYFSLCYCSTISWSKRLNAVYEAYPTCHRLIVSYLSFLFSFDFDFDWEWCVLNGKRCIFMRKFIISSEGFIRKLPEKNARFTHALLQKSIRHRLYGLFGLFCILWTYYAFVFLLKESKKKSLQNKSNCL